MAGWARRARPSAEALRLEDIKSARSGNRASKSDSGGLESNKAIESCGSVSTVSRNEGRMRISSRSASGVASAEDCDCFCWRRSLARESLVEAAAAADDDDDEGFGSGGVAVEMARSKR